MEIVQILKAIMMMTSVQLINAGMVLLYKLTSSENAMSIKVLVAFRNIIAALVICPLAFYIESNKRPKPTKKILLQAFACALFGQSIVQNLYAESIKSTSATISSALMNLLPGFTFIIALLFGLEKAMLNTVAGKAKVAGLIISVCGAMILVFYQGFDILNRSPHQVAIAQLHHQSFLGPAFAILSCFCAALSFNIQKFLSDNYPYPYSSTALICIFGAIQSTLYALAFERDWDHWKLGFNISLLASLYAGLLASVLAICLTMWCFQVKGPMFVTGFIPLMHVVVTITSIFLPDEQLYLGSIIGAVIIVCGLYLVLWGNGKEVVVGPRAEDTDAIIDDDVEAARSENIALGSNVGTEKTVLWLSGGKMWKSSVELPQLQAGQHARDGILI